MIPGRLVKNQQSSISLTLSPEVDCFSKKFPKTCWRPFPPSRRDSGVHGSHESLPSHSFDPLIHKHVMSELMFLFSCGKILMPLDSDHSQELSPRGNALSFTEATVPNLDCD